MSLHWKTNSKFLTNWRAVISLDISFVGISTELLLIKNITQFDLQFVIFANFAAKASNQTND